MTFREFGYACLDMLKLSSDDSFITLDHCLFVGSKIRSLLLKELYKDIKKDIPESNYLTICFNLQETDTIPEDVCNNRLYLKSNVKIPTTLPIGSVLIYPLDYYSGSITFVSKERMRYVGHNKWLLNIIYASIGPDGYLYMKSDNPQYLYLHRAKLTAIFEDTLKVALELSSCDSNTVDADDSNNNCDWLNQQFPIEEGLVSSIIEMTVKYLNGTSYLPKDTINNANDDFSNIMKFIRLNMKSAFAKKFELA